MLHQNFRRSELSSSHHQFDLVPNRLGAALAGDWIISARTIRIGTCALIYDSSQFGICIANADEMAQASYILFGTKTKGPALYDILNQARRIMTVNVSDPIRAFRLVQQFCDKALPQIELTAREAERLVELNQLIQREASSQTRAKVQARWAAEDRLFADTESGKTQERDDHGRYADGGGNATAPDFKKAAKWLNDHAVEKYGEHKCLEHVQNGLAEDGIHVAQSGFAKNAGPAFEAAGFVKIQDDGNYKMGDVVIFSQPGNGISKDGHIAMWGGQKWVSYEQDDMYPSRQAKWARVPHTIYRYSPKFRGNVLR